MKNLFNLLLVIGGYATFLVGFFKVTGRYLALMLAGGFSLILLWLRDIEDKIKEEK